jgi:hypothetical protein
MVPRRLVQALIINRNCVRCLGGTTRVYQNVSFYIEGGNLCLICSMHQGRNNVVTVRKKYSLKCQLRDSKPPKENRMET